MVGMALNELGPMVLHGCSSWSEVARPPRAMPCATSIRIPQFGPVCWMPAIRLPYAHDTPVRYELTTGGSLGIMGL